MFEKLIDIKNSNSHYIKKYIKFIFIRIFREINDGYKEKHHIVPKSLGGLDNKDNLIYLTPREHLLAHYILAKAFGGNQWFSVNLMMKSENPYQKRKNFTVLNSRLYEEYKIQYIKNSKVNMINIRSKESLCKKNSRIEKWKNKYNNKSKEEKEDIFNKVKISLSKKSPEALAKSRKLQIETRKSNILLGIKNRIIYPKTKCNICEKYICDHNIEKHIKVCNINKNKKIKNIEEVLKRREIRKEITKNINIEKKIKEKIIKNNIKDSTNKKILEEKLEIKLLKQIKKLIEKELILNIKKHKISSKKINIKIEKKNNIIKNRKIVTTKKDKIKSRIKCNKCGGSFNSNETFNKHLIIKMCNISDEEKDLIKEKNKINRYKRVSITKSKWSEEDKERIGNSISLGLKKSINELSEEMKIKRNENTKLAMLNYYNSDKYNPKKRSMEIKSGMDKSKKDK